MKKLLTLPLLLFAMLIMGGCGGKDVATPLAAEVEPGPVVVERSNRLLILPFDCNILPAKDASTISLLQNLVSSQMVYMLQLAGVPAEQYTDGAQARGNLAASYSALMPGGYNLGQGLTEAQSQNPPSPSELGAATSFEEVEDWNAQVVPPRNVRQYGEPVESVAVGDYDPIDRFEQQPQEAEPEFGSERARLLADAKKRGYDYVVIGTIALVRTDVSPTVTIGGAERATIRSEINTAFQLIDTSTGEVKQTGAARGRDAKQIVVKDGVLNSYHVYGALDRVVQESVKEASKRMAERLADKSLDALLADEELEDEASFYQDSPGKRLRP